MPKTKIASFNSVEPYLRFVFRIYPRIQDATFITTGGTKVLSQGHDRQTFLAPYLQAAHTHAQSLEEVAQ
jgi:FMN-dependent NADH-azoreductase